ncbi:unnamed protein product [Urochloa humidicola]
MPELPEVEAARRALQAHCVGRRIARCAVADDAKVVVAAAGRAAFERAMVGRTIVAARRKGKNLWLQLDAPPFPSFQFGMAGAIYIKGVPVTNYKRSVVNSDEEWPSKYSKFFAQVVKYAVEVDADLERFPKEWLFHHRWGKKPGTVNGKKIQFITAGGRTTAYVPQLQKLTGTQSKKMVAANLEQLSENGDAKDSEIDGEDADMLKPKKRVTTSRAARGHQNKETIGANSRKARGNSGGSKKPGTDVEDAEVKTAVTNGNVEQGSDQSNGNAVNKSDQVKRRSSRRVKPRK